MQLYQGTKKVLAKPMKLGEYNKYRGWELPQDEDGNSDGYLIEYLNGGKPNHPDHKGYISWSPSKVFDDAYKPIADAQDAIEQGKVINLGEFLLAVDAKLHGSAGFDYVFYDNSKADRPYLGTVSFQRGNPNEVVNGLANEVLLAVLMDRIEVLDGRVPHDSNKVALDHLKSAYDALCARVRDRKERGVMFTDKV